MSRDEYTPSARLDSSNAIWDDGEWISWDEISRYIDGTDSDASPERQDEATPGVRTIAEMLTELDQMITDAREMIDRDQQSKVKFGEMGELYAEIRYGIKRHRKNAQGSDGRIGNDFVEVKTITPWKGRKRVSVLRRGHFSKLVVVKIDENFMFDARMISRSRLAKGSGGKSATVSWSSLPNPNQPNKAPEPTPGAVTPRATERASK